MRVLLTGATGFIGSAVAAALASEGHSIIATGRRGGAPARALPADGWASVDLARAVRPEDWAPHLVGVDAVVNCAGILQDSPNDSTKATHADGPAALFEACERAGIRRVIHLSAIGVDVAQPTAFSRTKLAGESALRERDLDWVILRPSVVLGRAAYGGGALMRGLAALPILPVMPGGGPLQVVQLDDLVRTFLFFLAPGAPGKIALDVAGPERLSFTDIVVAYRRWLGFTPARRLNVPDWLAGLAYRAGDIGGWLGWRPPVRSTAQAELKRGAVGDPGPWSQATGIAPASLRAALAAEPASVQERWFAQLYFLKPLGFAIFVAFWIGTGVISLTIGWDIGKRLMFDGGVADPLASIVVVAGALADIAIGLLIAWRRTTCLGLYAALAISVAYTIIGSAMLPQLWSEPLGPMLKIWPILAFNLMLLAILRDR